MRSRQNRRTVEYCNFAVRNFTGGRIQRNNRRKLNRQSSFPNACVLGVWVTISVMTLGKVSQPGFAIGKFSFSWLGNARHTHAMACILPDSCSYSSPIRLPTWINFPACLRFSSYINSLSCSEACIRLFLDVVGCLFRVVRVSPLHCLRLLRFAVAPVPVFQSMTVFSENNSPF